MAKAKKDADMREDVLHRLIPLIMAELYDDNIEIKLDSDFKSLGMDSIDMLDMVGPMESEFGVDLDIEEKGLSEDFNCESTVKEVVDRLCTEISKTKK